MKLKTHNIETQTIGLLTILLFLWLVLYFIPEVFVSLFNTLLGNLILIVVTLLVYMKNRLYGFISGIVLLLLYRFSQLSNKEAFTNESVNTFLQIQNTINKQKVFDMNVIDTQATQRELDSFNKDGVWPWSPQTIALYENAVKHNPYVRSIPALSTDNARTIYNESAILRILSYQTKEGNFLLNGVLVKNHNSANEIPNGVGNFGYTSGLITDKTYDVIKCKLHEDHSEPTLERIIYGKKGPIFGEQTEYSENVDYHDLENIIPGFTFSKSPCNPCKAMSKIPDYSCAFNLKTDAQSTAPSDIWKYLWN